MQVYPFQLLIYLFIYSFIFAVMGMELRVVNILSKQSTIELHPQLHPFIFYLFIYLSLVGLGFEFRALYLQSRHSTA
jgi:hypothetical protein